MSSGYRSFWAKAHPVSASVAFHPLVAHSLDVAAVALLMPCRPLPGLDARMVGLLVALHDIGKISRPFQAKEQALWPEVALGAFPGNVPPGPAHDVLGQYVLEKLVGGTVLPEWPTGAYRGAMWRALAGHHGRPAENISKPFQSVLCDGCRAAASDFAEAMGEVFRPPPCAQPRTHHDVLRLAWRLAGLTTLADWVGSRQAWFPYVPVDAVADPAGYFWNKAVPQAGAALAAAGLAAAEPAPFGGIRKLFPGVSHPSPVQAWAETVELPAGPLLAVIEDLTGSGKTEAAITLAHRLLSDGRAQGIYVGLPTMATANAMYGRMAEAYVRLFMPEARPSLALAHGRAELNPRFRAAFAPDAAAATGGAADPADDPAEAHCAAWLAQDRRRAMLANVGVGTLDQALLAALPVRHATLRLHGLASKVLIVDEAHAFDPYMRQELTALLRFQAALGGSAILLSATLPHATRQELADAFRNGLDAPSATLRDTNYPLATLVAAEHVSETECGVRDGLARHVKVTRLDDAEAAVERVVAASGCGAAVAWVRNTVDDAIAAASMLRERGLDPLLFHARFAMVDRLAIEAEVLRCFGRTSAGEARRRVLVATQIIEQSLDLDFDVMCTDLAPADLLIQRAGRLWRHRRDGRPIAEPELLVVSPEPVDDPAAHWIVAPQPGTAAVYRDPALLWRSARAVFSRGAISTPEDMRPLIEAAADRYSVPPALEKVANDAEAKRLSQGGIGVQNALKVWCGYERTAGLWETDDRTPTRLEEQPHVTLRLALLRDGVVVPYAVDADPRCAWALSEVSVPQYRIAACPLPPGTGAAADEARRGWTRWERESDKILLAMLTWHDTLYSLVIQAESGATGHAWYSARGGLEWLEPASAG